MSGIEPSDELLGACGPGGEAPADSGGLAGVLTDAQGVLLDAAAARRAFDALRDDPAYLWQYIDDCCLARAHKACAALRAWGIACEKIRVDNAHGTWLGSFGLAVRKDGAPGGFVFMGFHIAPLVRARTPGGLVEYVFDPALCDGPASIEEWAGKLINRDSLAADGSIDPAAQDKDFTRLGHDVFEKVLYWENKDEGMRTTLALLASHRQEYELKLRLREPGALHEPAGTDEPGEAGEPGEPDMAAGHKG